MDPLAFEHHLTSPQGAGHIPRDACTVTVEGGACCDRVTFSLRTDGSRVSDAGFVAEGCGAAGAAASAAVSLVRGTDLLSAARVGTAAISAELGGLSAAKRHAADVAAEALARALGGEVRRGGALAPPTGTTRTLVAMSGGVDSSVVALLCAEIGEVAAVTLELWADDENDAEGSCCSAGAVARARALAHSLGLAHFTLDLRDRFRAGVVEPFIAGYAAGETPNPCVGCNGHVRLDAMIEFADRLGAATLATGHYARVHRSADGRPPLLRAAADPAKDQTYMLAALAPTSLERMRFPLGDMTKPEVRAIAAAHGLSVARRPDSQDLCFLAGTNRARFLARHGGGRATGATGALGATGARDATGTLGAPTRGDVVNEAGELLGHHDGHELFTVGQRRGVGVAGGEPLYVLAKHRDTNRVVVGPRERLATRRVRIRGARLHDDGARVDRVKLRYRSAPLPARIAEPAGTGAHRELLLELAEPVLGAAPGQLACLMCGEVVVGWGTITA